MHQWWAWTWGWVPPGGAADRFHFGDNPIADVARLGVVFTGVILGGLIVRVLIEQRRREERMMQGQVLRFVSLFLFALSTAVTECWVMGTPATPRLIVNIAAMATAALGVWHKRKMQLREPLVP